MKKSIHFLIVAFLLGMTTAFTSCIKDHSILVSSQDLLFGLEDETQTFIVRANCKWSITKNDDADWYTITPMSGKAKDSIVTVTVNKYSEGDFRGSSFVVNSPGGHVRRTVFVSQNKIDFYSMINKVFGVKKLEQWNTDYYGQIIEDSYRDTIYDPYDTTTGYLVYFLEDGKGLQRDHHTDTVAWWAFDYEFDAVNQILHVSFETVDGAPEDYSPDVLTASDSLYRFFHQYKPNFWERADMRKIGTVITDEKLDMIKKTAKRKKGQPIFIMD